MQAPPPPPTPPSYPPSHPSPKFVEGESWWNRTVQVRLIDIIHAALTSVPGFDLEALARSASSSSKSKEDSSASASSSDPEPVDVLLQHPQCDAAIKIAYDLLHKSVPERVPPPDLNSATWKDNKHKIVMMVVDMCKRTQSGGIVLPPINQAYMPRKDIIWGTFLPPVNQQDTPARTLPPAEELARSAPMSMPTPAESDIATPRNPAEVPNNNNMFSPADSVVSSASRRRRSSSSVTDSVRSPSKRARARGPQEHACSHCGKSFPFRSKLMDHMRIHENVKGFSCPICQKGFKRSREVAAHTKAVHKTQHAGMHSMSPDTQPRILHIQPRMSAVPVAVRAGAPLLPAESAQQALFSMPTPAADTPIHPITSPEAIKTEPIDVHIGFAPPAPENNISRPDDAAEQAHPPPDQDEQMRSGSPGDERPVVKPMYRQPGKEPGPTDPDIAEPASVSAPPPTTEESTATPAPAPAEPTIPPSKAEPPKPLTPDRVTSPKPQPTGGNDTPKSDKSDATTSSGFKVPSVDPNPGIEEIISTTYLHNISG